MQVPAHEVLQAVVKRGSLPGAEAEPDSIVTPGQGQAGPAAKAQVLAAGAHVVAYGGKAGVAQAFRLVPGVAAGHEQQGRPFALKKPLGDVAAAHQPVGQFHGPGRARGQESPDVGRVPENVQHGHR